MTVARVLFIALCMFTGVATLRATLTVTGMTTNTTSGSPSAAEGYTFENGQRSVTTFTTASATYGVASQANNVFVRRNGVNNDQSSVWYVSSGVGTNLSGMHGNAYGPLLTSNNIFAGSDNTFANGTANTTGNIERLDFTWNSGLTVTNSVAFAVFDRGAVGVHDSFAIAAVTAIDASGNPTAYASLVKVAAGWGGATNPIADFNYRLFRYSNGDVLTASTANTEVATQGIGGIVITAADLGLTIGTTIYGYSLMAVDVTAATSAQLLDWTNGTFYPTTTDGSTGGGGIDLAALNGMAFGIVPEPTPSAGLLGAFLALVSICHHIRTRGSRHPS
jgi:hypothetical protein